VNIASSRIGYQGKEEKMDPHARATGVFEEIIFDSIK
jgi:hypothetical protein